eukprot:m.75762 g.75762  ORF g.75762 m.75762 type:complete len:997 (+) comp14492_c0_seq2:100-3090(+)
MDPDGIVAANTGDPPDAVLAVAPLDQLAAQATPPPATLMTAGGDAAAAPARFEVSKLLLSHSGTAVSQGLPLEPVTPPHSPAARGGQPSHRRRPPPLVDVTGCDADLGAAVSTGSVKSTRSSDTSPVRQSLHTVDGIPPGVRLEGYLYLLLDEGSGPTMDTLDWHRRYCIFLPTHRIMFVLLHPKQARPLLECHREDVDNAEALFRVDEMPVPQLWRRGSGRGQRKSRRQQRPPRRPSRIGQSLRGLFSSKRAPPVVHFVSNNLMDVPSIDEPLVIDLANSWARELHPSVCTDVLDGTAFFQISHGTSRTLFRCQHGLEQAAWLSALQEAVVPVNESVGINHLELELVKFAGAESARHVYQCEARVGSFVEAISTKKARTGPDVAWNERFCLHNLTGAAAGQSVSIVVYRWLDPRSQHLNSARDLVGVVEIPLRAGEGALQSCTKQLEPLSSAAASPIADATFQFVPRAGAERGSLLVRWCRREVTVRPLEFYEAMTTHVMSHPAEVSKSMEQFEEHFQEPDDSDNLLVLYEAMVCMLAAKTSSLSSFLIDLVLQYAKSNPPGPNKPFTFRGNSCASRALEQYIVLNAREFIQRLLHDSIYDACEDVARNGPCPVAGPGLKASEIETNVRRVRYHVEHIWNTIMKAQGRFPANVRVLFHTLTLKLVKANFKRSVADTILCSTVALRFIVRCVASPTDVDILQHKPNRALHEFLAKIAKVLTALFHGSKLTSMDPLYKLNDTFLIPEREAGRANDFFETLRTPPLATRHSEPIPKPNLRHFSAMFHSIVDRYTDSDKCPWSAELCNACRNPEPPDASQLEVGDEDVGPKRTPSSATSIATSIAPVTSVPEYAKSLRSAGVCDETSERDPFEDAIQRSISAPVSTGHGQSRFRLATAASSAPVTANSISTSAESFDADLNQAGSKRRLFHSVHRRSRQSGVHKLPPPCEADEAGHSMALTKGGLRLHNTLLQAQTNQSGVKPEEPLAPAKPDVQTALV